MDLKKTVKKAVATTLAGATVGCTSLKKDDSNVYHPNKAERTELAQNEDKIVGWTTKGAVNIIDKAVSEYEDLDLKTRVYKSGVHDYDEVVKRQNDHKKYYAEALDENKDMGDNYDNLSNEEKLQYIKDVTEDYCDNNPHIDETEKPNISIDKVSASNGSYEDKTGNLKVNQAILPNKNQTKKTLSHELYHLDQNKGEREGSQKELLDLQNKDLIYNAKSRRGEEDYKEYKNSPAEYPAHNTNIAEQEKKVVFSDKPNKTIDAINKNPEIAGNALNEGLLTKAEA
jgi:hypothetical protein